MNFDTRRVLQGEGDEQCQYQEVTAAPGNSGGVQVGWGAPSAAAWDAHRLALDRSGVGAQVLTRGPEEDAVVLTCAAFVTYMSTE